MHLIKMEQALKTHHMTNCLTKAILTFVISEFCWLQVHPDPGDPVLVLWDYGSGRRP